VKNVRNFPKESRDNQTYTNGELENLNCWYIPATQPKPESRTLVPIGPTSTSFWPIRHLQ
jgi:hypothetical protein